jgi:hypothetical protein
MASGYLMPLGWTYLIEKCEDDWQKWPIRKQASSSTCCLLKCTRPILHNPYPVWSLLEASQMFLYLLFIVSESPQISGPLTERYPLQLGWGCRSTIIPKMPSPKTRCPLSRHTTGNACQSTPFPARELWSSDMPSAYT